MVPSTNYRALGRYPTGTAEKVNLELDHLWGCLRVG